MNASPAGPQVAHRICPLCEACCGLSLTVQDGRVVAVRGDETDVFSRGYLCPKAVALKDLHDDPDRVRTPLVRRDGRLQPATWDEAFATIARRLPPLLQQHGRDALAFSLGNPVVHKAGLLLYVARLARAAGTRNIFSASTLDQMPKQLACGLMFGDWLSIPVPDIARTDLLLVLGANPAVSNGSLWTVPDFRGKARALRARGGRLVVIDPRRTETADLADEHLPIVPGTDGALLAAMAHTLFDEGLVRPGALAPHLAGLETLPAALAPFAPERVAARCGIAAVDIRRLARELAATPRAAVYGRIGTCTQAFGTLASWLVEVLNALTGHLDVEGGAMFPLAPAFANNASGPDGRGRGVVTGRHRSRVAGAPEVYGELPITCLAEEIETPGPGQVRALISVASNPVLSAPNGARLAAALDTLDFMVAIDVYVNETTRHADVVLPGCSPLEDSHFDVAFPQFAWRNAVRFSEAVLARPVDHPPEWQVLLRLQDIVAGRGGGQAGRDDATAPSAAEPSAGGAPALAAAEPSAASGAQLDAVLALDDALALADVRRFAGDSAEAVLAAVAPLRGPERLFELALRAGPYGDGFGRRPDGLTLARVRAAPAGIDLGPLQPRLPAALRTPSGKVELAPPQLLADLARLAADLANAPPSLVVIGRRQVRSNNSWMHNLPTLAKGRDRCTLEVHPDDAARHGLADGALAKVRSTSVPARTVQARVEVTDRVARGVVSLPHGWGHDLPGVQLQVAARQPGANVNALLDEHARDPLSGTAVLSGVEVTLHAS